MSNENDKLELSLKKVDKEAIIIYQLSMGDLSSFKTRMSVISCHMLPCVSISEIFSSNTRFEVIVEADWSKETIVKVNSGMSGLILDEFDKDNIFSKDVFKRFFLKINQSISSNKMLNALVLHHCIEEINRKYKNKYKLVEIEEIFVHFSRNSKNNIIPNICMEIQVERV
jgi:hypothetical protein